MSFLRDIFATIKGTGGEVISSFNNALSTSMNDGAGNPIGSFRGALNVHDADVHTEIINQQFHQHTATTTTFAVAATAGDTSITVVSATGFAPGDYLHLENGNIETPHCQITIITGNVLTLDAPLDNNFPIGATVIKSLVSMNVAGTLASPQSFIVAPTPTKIMHLTTILIEITHNTAGDNGLFGGIAALSNGVVLRRYDGATGTTSKFTNWKTNSDIVTDTGIVEYSARSGGGGSYGTNASGNFKNAGAIVYLDGATGDYLEILIQDDLSTLQSFRVKAQGHFETE